MTYSTNIRTGRHCTFEIFIHLVFVTKYRRKVFSKSHLNSLEKYFKKICMDFESNLIEFNGEDDHVHLLVSIPPKFSISKLVNSLKGPSSRLLKKDHPEIFKKYYKGKLWSPSYYAGSSGMSNLETIKNYIKEQRLSSPT